MKLRLGLTLLSVSLSLSISADRTLTNCPQAWFPNANSETFEQGLGVNIHFTDPQPGEMKMIAAAGFRWVRMDFKWDATERERGHYDFSAYDRLMQSLDQFKLRARPANRGCAAPSRLRSLRRIFTSGAWAWMCGGPGALTKRSRSMIECVQIVFALNPIAVASAWPGRP